MILTRGPAIFSVQSMFRWVTWRVTISHLELVWYVCDDIYSSMDLFYSCIFGTSQGRQPKFSWMTVLICQMIFLDNWTKRWVIIMYGFCLFVNSHISSIWWVPFTRKLMYTFYLIFHNLLESSGSTFYCLCYLSSLGLWIFNSIYWILELHILSELHWWLC